MKTLNTPKLLLAAIMMLFIASCQKDSILPNLTIGKIYQFKNHIFNKGAYQPVNALRLDSLYTDPASGMPYAKVNAKINWNEFATDTKHGAKQMTVSGNMLTLKGLHEMGIDYGYDQPVEWEFPQEDLK